MHAQYWSRYIVIILITRLDTPAQQMMFLLIFSGYSLAYC